MTRSPKPRRRVHGAYVERIMQSLSARDWAVLETVSRLRLVTGSQLERLHFSELTGRTRQVMRWRVLKRLTDVRCLAALDRRVGAAPRGSAKLCFGLDTAGQRLAQLRANREQGTARVRRPGTPGERFVAHTLAVAGLYVALVEQTRLGSIELCSFLAEPAAWWPDGQRRWLKPDAFAVLATGQVTDYWWCEVDLATESLSTVCRKLAVYLDFLKRGQLGPDGIMPRVVVAVATTARQDAIRTVVDGLPDPAGQLFSVTTLDRTSEYLVKEITN